MHSSFHWSMIALVWNRSVPTNIDAQEEKDIMKMKTRQIEVDISHILGNLITVIFNYQILRKPLKILSL